MPVQPQQPVSEDRAVAIANDDGIGPDSGGAHDGFERRAVDEPVLAVFQVGVNVPQDRAGDVPLGVRFRTDVDLHDS